MMMIRTAVLSMLLGTSSFVDVGAAPSGAGACPGGQAAVGGPHLSQGLVSTGALSVGGLSLDVDGVVVAEGGTITMTEGVPTTFTVMGGPATALASTSPPPGNFRGFLIRAEANSAMSEWTVALTDPNVSEAAACASTANLVGITHNSRVDKTSATGQLTLDGAEAGTTGTIDVTVVIENGGGISTYYYSGYTLEVVAGATPTDAPLDPTDAPLDPTDAPVDPTDAPVDPTDAPVDPTDAPVDPTDAPVDPPTDAPTSSSSIVTASSSAAVAVAVVASAMMM